MTDHDPVDSVLTSARTIAVVGCSGRPDRDSHRVAAYLQEAGYRMLPVNPGLVEVLGERVYPDLASIPADPPVDAVVVFRRPEDVPAVVEQLLTLASRPALWLQLGCANPAAEERARRAGHEVVSDRCIMVEHRRRQV